MDPRGWRPETLGAVGASLLLGSGTELLAAAAGVDVSGLPGAPTPTPLLFSFGVVSIAIGLGIVTRVMSMAWFGVLFNAYATLFLRLTAAKEATAYQLGSLALSAPCCLLLGALSGVTAGNLLVGVSGIGMQEGRGGSPQFIVSSCA